MTSLSPHRLVRALLRQPVDRTPVWIMRQAGRYLPEYCATRKRAGDFLSLCKDPDLCCEVALQPLQRFELDAAILFSDILTLADAMGLGLYFSSGEGPRFKHCIRSPADVAALPRLDMAVDLQYVMRAVQHIRRALNNQVPLIGFAGSPWTLATYMIEGGSSKDFAAAKALLYQDPDCVEQLLAHLTQATVDYLNAQIQAGAQVIQLFDTWGGLLSWQDYQRFSLAPMQRIIQGLRATDTGAAVPVILFTKGGGQWLESIAGSGCDAVGLDWTTSLAQARLRIGDQVALQGNLDPSVLYAQPQQIRQAVSHCLQQFGSGSGHIFNLGHGIHPQIDPQHLAACIDAVIELSPAYHQAS